MKLSALEGRGGMAVLFESLVLPAHCVFCGRIRPRELLSTWMCTKCKRKPLWMLIWGIEEAHP